jgi:hypothetical protein
MQVVYFDTLMRSPDNDGFLSPAGWKFPNWEGRKSGASKSAVQGSAIDWF